MVRPWPDQPDRRRRLCVVIKSQEIGFSKGSKSGMECGCLFQLGFYLLGTTITCKLSVLFKVLGLWLHVRSPIPASFLCYSCTLVLKRCRDGALYIYLHFYITIIFNIIIFFLLFFFNFFFIFYYFFIFYCLLLYYLYFVCILFAMASLHLFTSQFFFYFLLIILIVAIVSSEQNLGDNYTIVL